jgi:hypothetical protein
VSKCRICKSFLIGGIVARWPPSRQLSSNVAFFVILNDSKNLWPLKWP